MSPFNHHDLVTPRLHLRRPAESDWENIVYLRSDPQVNRFVNREPTTTKEKAMEFLARVNGNNDRAFAYYWAIADKTSGQMIGSICLWNLSDDRSRAELGYDLVTAQQGKGIMSEALATVLQFGFMELKFQLIDAYTHRDNAPSRRLLERNGFVLMPEKTDPDNAFNVIYELTAGKQPQL